jgi:hypothetical protein
MESNIDLRVESAVLAPRLIKLEEEFRLQVGVLSKIDEVLTVCGIISESYASAYCILQRKKSGNRGVQDKLVVPYII